MESILGRWELFSKGINSDHQYIDFLPDGKFIVIATDGKIWDYKHTWYIANDKLIFKFNNGYSTYTGSLQNGEITGNVVNVKSLNWTFSLHRINHKVPELPPLNTFPYQPLVGRWLMTTDADVSPQYLDVKVSGEFSLISESSGQPSGSNHNLKVVGDKMILSVNDNFCVYTGIIYENEVVGTAKNVKGKEFNYKAERINNSPILFTKTINPPFQPLIESVKKSRIEFSDHERQLNFAKIDQLLSVIELPWFDGKFKFPISSIKIHRNRTYKYFALNYYYPVSKYPDIPFEQKQYRDFIFNFKNGVGNTYEKAAINFANAIINQREFVLTNTIICCIIPASSTLKTNNRFNRFCKKISELLGVVNGFEVISNSQDVEAVHLGNRERGDISNFNFNRELISNKIVFVFDDVMTTGRSFGAIADRLVKEGAKEVYGFYLSKTYDAFTMGIPKWDK